MDFADSVDDDGLNLPPPDFLLPVPDPLVEPDGLLDHFLVIDWKGSVSHNSKPKQ